MQGDGLNAAYVLVDVIFTRELMTMTSWAGGSKSGERKVAFKMFPRILDFFHNLIQLADPTFTQLQTKDFFKNKVLVNAVRRSMSKMMRAPKARARRAENKIKRSTQPKFPVKSPSSAYTSNTPEDPNKRSHIADQTPNAVTTKEEISDLNSLVVAVATQEGIADQEKIVDQNSIVVAVATKGEIFDQNSNITAAATGDAIDKHVIESIKIVDTANLLPTFSKTFFDNASDTTDIAVNEIFGKILHEETITTTEGDNDDKTVVDEESDYSNITGSIGDDDEGDDDGGDDLNVSICLGNANFAHKISYPSLLISYSSKRWC